MNSKSIFFFVLAILCGYALKNWPRHATDSKQDNEHESVEITQPRPQKTISKEQAPPQAIATVMQSPRPIAAPKVAETSSSTNEAASPKTSMNQKFFERYQKSDITERLQHSRRLQNGDKIDTALTSASVYSIKTQTHDVQVYSSFDSYLQGCVSIGENKPIQGSTSNSAVEVFKLPEEHAYAIYVQKLALVVIYADIEKWGQHRGDEEPRLMLYYRKNAHGKWVLLGKGDDSTPYDHDQYRAQMQFCDFPHLRS